MNHHVKSLLDQLHSRRTAALVANHVTRVEMDGKGRAVTLHVDKRHCFNTLVGEEHMAPLIAAVKKAFGPDRSTVVQLDVAHFLPERERAFPHAMYFH